MSKGYYAIKPVVFHNIRDREKFLELNPLFIPITRLEAYKIHKKGNTEFYCESCYQLHTKNSVYKKEI